MPDQPYLTWSHALVSGGGLRTPVERATDVFEVTDYGVFDTPAHTRQAIQATVNAAIAAGGGIVFFPRGIYTIDQPIIVGAGGSPAAATIHGLRFVGCGTNVTGGSLGSTIVGDFSSSPDYLIRTAPSSFISSFEHLGFKQSGTFTINNTNPKGADDVAAWSSSTTYNAVSPAPFSQVYYTDGLFYENLQAGNLNHPPSSSPTFWSATGIDRNAQVGGGCIYIDSQRCRIIGCDFQVNSGIAIFLTQNNHHIESTGISGQEPANLAGRTNCIGIMFSHGIVQNARIYSIGIGVNAMAGGNQVNINRMIFENCGTAVLGGTAPVNWYNGNDHRYLPAGPAGGAVYIRDCSAESGWRGFENAAGMIDCTNCTVHSFVHAMDRAFIAGQYSKLDGCSTVGNFAVGAPIFDLSGATVCRAFGCNASGNAGSTPFSYPNLAGRSGVLQITASSSNLTTNSIFDGALPFAQLPALALVDRGTTMRCSDANVAFGNTTIGTVLTTGGSTNNIQITWDGTGWRITGP